MLLLLLLSVLRDIWPVEVWQVLTKVAQITDWLHAPNWRNMLVITRLTGYIPATPLSALNFSLERV